MSKQKIKKRQFSYTFVVSTDTDFKENLIRQVIEKQLPTAFAYSLEGKVNQFEIIRN